MDGSVSRRTECLALEWIWPQSLGPSQGSPKQSFLALTRPFATRGQLQAVNVVKVCFDIPSCDTVDPKLTMNAAGDLWWSKDGRPWRLGKAYGRQIWLYDTLASPTSKLLNVPYGWQPNL